MAPTARAIVASGAKCVVRTIGTTPLPCAGFCRKLSTAQPLIGMVSRLTEQKGIDLLFDSLPELLQARDFGLAARVGAGSGLAQNFFLAEVCPQTACSTELHSALHSVGNFWD